MLNDVRCHTRHPTWTREDAMPTDFSHAETWDETEPFACEVESLEGGGQLVRASGELDVHTCPEFQKVLAATLGGHPGRLVIDLSEVTFMDSTALGVLVVLQRGMKRPLDIIVTRPHLRRVLVITGLDMVFRLHSSLDEVRKAA
jgi:anti-sigma B factor antagonist